LMLFISCSGTQGLILENSNFHSRRQLVYCVFFNAHSGRWSANWVHSARRLLIGLLYLPRVIVRVENLVEWRFAGETEVFGEDLPQRHFVHHKSHLTRPGLQPGSPIWKASD
jgi:hypothetical protein